MMDWWLAILVFHLDADQIIMWYLLKQHIAYSAAGKIVKYNPRKNKFM